MGMAGGKHLALLGVFFAQLCQETVEQRGCLDHRGDAAGGNRQGRVGRLEAPLPNLLRPVLAGHPQPDLGARGRQPQRGDGDLDGFAQRTCQFLVADGPDGIDDHVDPPP